MGGGAAPSTRDPGVRIQAGLFPLQGGVGRSGRQRNAVGEGEKGPLPSPPPRPAWTPLAPARADGTWSNRPDAVVSGRSLARARPRRAIPRPWCLHPRVPGLGPSPLPSGGGCGRRVAPPNRSPRTPPQTVAPIPYQLGGEPGRPSGIEKRADTGKFWEREGRTLKGPRPLFSLEKKMWGAGGQTENWSAVEWRKQRKRNGETRAAVFEFFVHFPQTLPPNVLNPHGSQKVRQLFGNDASFLLVSQVFSWLR